VDGDGVLLHGEHQDLALRDSHHTRALVGCGNVTGGGADFDGIQDDRESWKGYGEKNARECKD
jgi:hypothetical protein